MGFQPPNLHVARVAIMKSLGEIASPYNDGFTSSSCKRDLYLLKCWLEDEYNSLPKFSGEESWEADRIWQRLKHK